MKEREEETMSDFEKREREKLKLRLSLEKLLEKTTMLLQIFKSKER